MASSTNSKQNLSHWYLSTQTSVGRELETEIDQTRKHESPARVDDEKRVYDPCHDHRERPPRASTSAWKASLLIIGIEFSERLSCFGISASFIIYLTTVIDEYIKTAVKNVNYWLGVTTMMPLIGGFLLGSYLGCFSTVIASSEIDILGLLLMTMSSSVPGLRPCDTRLCQGPPRVHEIVFFLAIYLISIGTEGHKPSLNFVADQFDDDDPRERRKKMSFFFNWWNFALCFGLSLGVTVIVYIQDHQ